MTARPAAGDADTNWPIVWTAFGAGAIAAAHLGKLPLALPEIRASFGAGLVTAGWIASIFSATGFALGLIAGGIADRIGLRRVLVFGLLALALGSLVGSLAPSAAAMLVARLVEGIGFTAATITGGAIIARATATRDRKWALGIWAIYMPTGFAGMMIIAALVLDIAGWRALWVFVSMLTVAWTMIVLRATRTWHVSQAGAISPQSALRNVSGSLRQVGCVLVAACFALYAAQHLSMMNWLPTYIQEVYGSGVLLAATVPALILIFNGAGNFVAAFAMGRGLAIWLLLALGSAGMALTEIGVFSSLLPDLPRLLLALGFGIAGGLIPAAALAATPLYAPTPVQVGTLNGLMVMGSNTGQLFGPPALAAVRETAGSWEGTLWFLLVLAVTGFACALASRGFEKRREVSSQPHAGA